MRLEGELDVASAPELTHELCQAQSGALLVVLDLRDLAFMDSAGVHVVVDATATARRHGRRLVLVRAPALVHAVFERTQTTGDVEVVHLEAGEPAVQVLPSLEQRRLAS
jgi:anti-anti-sigma factor